MCRKPCLSVSPVFGHAIPKVNFVLISRLTNKYATHNLQTHTQVLSMDMLTYHGYIKGAKMFDDFSLIVSI